MWGCSGRLLNTVSWPELSQSESSVEGGLLLYSVLILVWCARARETSRGGAGGAGGGAAGGEGVNAASLSPLYPLGAGGAGGGAVLPSGSPRPTSVLDVDPRTYIVNAPPHEPNGSGGGGTEDALSSVEMMICLD